MGYEAPETSRRRPLWLALLVQLRPKQWTKNAFCLAGLVFSGQLFQLDALIEALLGVAAFSAGASAVYVLNDLFDREKDRQHARTRRRPIAAGEIPISLAVLALLLLLTGALTASLWLGFRCLVVMLLYSAMNVAYSTRLKHLAVLDVLCIALGFVLRVLYGIYAVQVLPTAWIVMCMFFLALFLGFAKRKAEMNSAELSAQPYRQVLRMYNVPFLDMCLAITAPMTIMCYALFTVASHRNPTLVVTVAPVTYCVLRYLMQVLIHGKGESPEGVLLSDRTLWWGVAVWFILCVLILYGNVHFFVETSALPSPAEGH